ncbi:MAG TPA: hypothetical protein VNM92_04945 [Thermoanaerobaculia bacterium]|nr:hypothetical protein [Thermoanaerobaculia bacterium]
MKVLKSSHRLSVRSPLRAVSLQFRDYQVTAKIKTPVPHIKPAFSR